MRTIICALGIVILSGLGCKAGKGNTGSSKNNNNNPPVTVDGSAGNNGNEEVKKDSMVCKPVLLDTAGYNRPSDPFTLLGAEVKGKCIEIEVEYGGGCGGDEWNLYWNGTMAKSLPPKVNIVLHLQDKDFCKALIRKKICFDVSSVYKGEVSFQLKDFRGMLMYKPVGN